MAASMLRRIITPFAVSRIRQNQRLLTTSVLHVVEPSSSPSTEAVHLTDNCVRRIRELQNEGSSEGRLLRLAVETGGCSGFQYAFELDNKTDSDDRLQKTQAQLADAAVKAHSWLNNNFFEACA
uniref:Uncharacterized protein n=1 Tax=Kalanchoe fedtschenkoi TaxID=63787 RepID=A0A7N0TGY1_KALFE